LPYGPVLMSPKTLPLALAEAALGPAEQKARTLQSLLGLLDTAAGSVAGAYGNKQSDADAYRLAGISPDRVYLVSTNSQMKKASDGSLTSYSQHRRGKDWLYPPL